MNFSPSDFDGTGAKSSDFEGIEKFDFNIVNGGIEGEDRAEILPFQHISDCCKRHARLFVSYRRVGPESLGDVDILIFGVVDTFNLFHGGIVVFFFSYQLKFRTDGNHVGKGSRRGGTELSARRGI